MLITGDEPDIICITEVIPKAQVHPLSSALLNIPHYSLFLNFDPSVSHLGSSGLRGVAIYASDQLLVAEISFPGNSFSEQIWLRVRLSGNDVLQLGCIYRSPSSEDANSQQLCALLKEVMDAQASHLLIVGDFNFGDIDWETGRSSATETHMSHQFIEAVQDSFLHQHVQSPTRYRLGQVPHILDLVLTNEEGMVSNLTSHPGLGNSDHVVIKFTMRTYTVRHQYQNARLAINKGDYAQMARLIAEVPWGEVEDANLHDHYNFFRRHFDVITEQCIPKLSSRVKKRNLYMTRGHGP